ncbi:molybdopterin molybdotransferase MoeA [Gaoshiqia sp. Z1-71]|uniref:molybdopterin molybdotransferase MoeA n=1 Tax=Gaoshiqia hydrogeniformans TaxID=3290090 RepID=UPI003BF8EDB0
MAHFEEVKQCIENSIRSITTERINLLGSLNKVLQEDVIADLDMPPFNKSAVDGYACRKEDLGNELEVIEVVQAGKLPSKTIGPNQCSKIMTGAMVPPGANCVFMIEHARLIGENRVICTNTKTKENICYQAEDNSCGDILIKKGTLISPAHIGIMAGAGYTEITVSRAPVTGMIATGTELVEPGKKPLPGQIRNSNSTQLMAQLQLMGIPCNDYGIISDDFEQISSCFERSLAENDLVLITGGASVGDYDFVASILKNQGFELLVEKTGIQPGNPMTFSKKNKKYCFGLSGNPVSSFIQFELFVKPFICAYMGGQYQPTRIKGILDLDFHRKKAVRFGFVPVKFSEGKRVEHIGFHGSAHLNALAHANAFMEIPAGVSSIKKGQEVYVQLF